MSIQQLTGLGGNPRLSSASQAPNSTASTPAAPQPPPVQIQRVAAQVAQNLQFFVDKATGKSIVRVVDSETKEVVRQIPTEEVISIARALDQMQGLLFNGKA